MGSGGRAEVRFNQILTYSLSLTLLKLVQWVNVKSGCGFGREFGGRSFSPLSIRVPNEAHLKKPPQFAERQGEGGHCCGLCPRRPQRRQQRQGRQHETEQPGQETQTKTTSSSSSGFPNETLSKYIDP